jgi:hypothetical protein
VGVLDTNLFLFEQDNNSFANLMEHLGNDFINALPMQEYCHPKGPLNLASQLPGELGKPDLGPNMYFACGMAKTNLHFERCDVVNVIIYVGELHNDTNGIVFLRKFSLFQNL